MVEDDYVGCQSSGVGQRLLRVDGFVQTKFEIYRIARQRNFLEVGTANVPGTLLTPCGSFPLEFSESLDISVNGDEPLCLERWVEELSPSRPDKKHGLACKVVKTAKVPCDFFLVNCQVKILSRRLLANELRGSYFGHIPFAMHPDKSRPVSAEQKVKPRFPCLSSVSRNYRGFTNASLQRLPGAAYKLVAVCVINATQNHFASLELAFDNTEGAAIGYPSLLPLFSWRVVATETLTLKSRCPLIILP